MYTVLPVLPKKPPIMPLCRFQNVLIHHQTQSILNPISRPSTISFFGTCQPRHRKPHVPSNSSEQSSSEDQPPKLEPAPFKPNPQEQRKSLAERDADHLAKMREVMGGADHSNVEMEDGVPDRGMKRNVRENMFRII